MWVWAGASTVQKAIQGKEIHFITLSPLGFRLLNLYSLSKKNNIYIKNIYIYVSDSLGQFLFFNFKATHFLVTNSELEHRKSVNTFTSFHDTCVTLKQF